MSGIVAVITRHAAKRSGLVRTDPLVRGSGSPTVREAREPHVSARWRPRVRVR